MKDGPVLLVEDNPDDELLTLRALRNTKIKNEIIVARDGAEAIDYLHGNGPQGNGPLRASIVLLDLKLPKMDGLQVLEQIRGNERTKYLPVIILTSSDEQEDMVRSYQIGVNSYVRKPVDFKNFIDAVSDLGIYWLILNEQPRSGV